MSGGKWRIGRLPEQYVCRGLLFLGFALAVCLATFFPDPMWEPDDWAYYYGIENFSHGRLTVTSDLHRQQVSEARSKGGRFIQYVELPNGRWALEKAPGYVFFAVPFKLMGIPRSANLVLAAGAAMAMYLLLRRVSNERAAVAGVFLLLFSPAGLIMLQRSYMDTFASLSFLSMGASLYFLAVHYSGSRPRPALLALAGLLLGWAVVVRYTNLVVVALFGIHYLTTRTWTAWRSRDVRSVLKEAVPLAAGVSVPATVLLLYNSFVFGSPLSQGYQYSDLPTQFAFELIGQPGRHGGSAFWEIIAGNARNLPQPLLLGCPLLVASIPALICLTAQTGSAERRVPAGMVVLLVGWFAVLYGLHFLYSWTAWFNVTSTRNFIVFARFFLPALFPQAAAVGILLGKASRPVVCGAIVTAALVASVVFVQSVPL